MTISTLVNPNTAFINPNPAFVNCDRKKVATARRFVVIQPPNPYL